MSVSTLPQRKPFVEGETVKTFWKLINWTYWLQRAPMFLLSLPAAYGVSAFASAILPAPFNWLAGLGFESVYLGAVALADQMYDSDDYTTFLWWLLNIIAVIMSALINTLFASDNMFRDITPEALVHGVPLPVLSFGYSLLLHQVTHMHLIKDAAKRKLQEDQDALTAFKCKYCGDGFPKQSAVYGHYKSCEKRKEIA